MGAEPDCCVVPPAPDRRPGPARRMPVSVCRIARARRSDGGRTVDGSSERVRGWRPTWAAEEAARAPDPRLVAAGPTDGGLPRPGDLWPWGQGSLTGSGLSIHSLLQITGLQHAASTRLPWAFTLFFASLSHCNGNETLDGGVDAGLAPALAQNTGLGLRYLYSCSFKRSSIARNAAAPVAVITLFGGVFSERQGRSNTGQRYIMSLAIISTTF